MLEHDGSPVDCHQCGPPFPAVPGHLVCSVCLRRIEEDRKARYGVSPIRAMMLELAHEDLMKQAAEMEREERLELGSIHG